MRVRFFHSESVSSLNPVRESNTIFVLRRSSRRVCHRCLVGEFVPVFRPNLSRFMFGQVLDCRMNDDTGNGLQFCILFDSIDHTSSNKEWLKVAFNPFEAYVRFNQQQSRQKSHCEMAPSPRCSSLLMSNAFDAFGSQWSVPYRHESNVSQFYFVAPVFFQNRNSQSTFQDDVLFIQSWVANHSAIQWPHNDKWGLFHDAQLFYYRTTMGPQWSRIGRLLRKSKVVVEERFHFVRQSLARDVAHLNPNIRCSALPVKKDVLRRLMPFNTADDEMEKSTANVINLLEESVHRRKKPSVLVLNRLATNSFLLELVPEGSPECCRRCGFFVPSDLTGLKVCRNTKWCEACCTTPAYFCGDILRMAHAIHNPIK
jgi:hypothetical protein